MALLGSRLLQQPVGKKEKARVASHPGGIRERRNFV
jgi:hypothetical protein